MPILRTVLDAVGRQQSQRSRDMRIVTIISMIEALGLRRLSASSLYEHCYQYYVLPLQG